VRLSARPPLLLICTLAAAAALTLVLVLALGRDTTPSYADQLRRICKHAYEPLKTTWGNYYENVVTVSALKHQGLSRLVPPPEHAAFHRELVQREQRMFDDALAAQNRVAQAMAIGGIQAIDPAEFPTLRAAQARLDSWYRRVGVEHCSD
jgi:hypothetical protein